MRHLMTRTAMGAGLALLAFGAPATAQTPSADTAAAVVPGDEESLRSLEQAHLRIVRGANRVCSSGKSYIRGSRPTPCIISGVMRGLDIADDPVLKAYHAALPMAARYDERRPQTVWKTVANRTQAGGAAAN